MRKLLNALYEFMLKTNIDLLSKYAKGLLKRLERLDKNIKKMKAKQDWVFEELEKITIDVAKRKLQLPEHSESEGEEGV